MGKWREAFSKSLGRDSDYDVDTEFEFGPPATPEQLAALEAAMSAKIPPELRELLCEFNGVEICRGDERETWYFSADKMPEASSYYNTWGDQETTDQCRKVLFVCQENGLASMWGVVAKPFADFKVGRIVAFDHDRVCAGGNGPFVRSFRSLQALVEAPNKLQRAVAPTRKDQSAIMSLTRKRSGAVPGSFISIS